MTNRKSGIVLIAVVLILALLMVMSVAFVTITRSDRLQTQVHPRFEKVEPRTAKSLSEAFSTRIQETLVRDLFSTDAATQNLLLDPSKTGSPYDQIRAQHYRPIPSFLAEADLKVSDPDNVVVDAEMLTVDGYNNDNDPANQRDRFLASAVPEASVGDPATGRVKNIHWPFISAPFDLGGAGRVTQFFCDPTKPFTDRYFDFSKPTLGSTFRTNFKPTGRLIERGTDKESSPRIYPAFQRSGDPFDLRLNAANNSEKFIGADTDGDGICDAGLQPIPQEGKTIDATTVLSPATYEEPPGSPSEGVTWFVGYRVVDNCALINVNTALSSQGDNKLCPHDWKSGITFERPDVGADSPNFGFFRSNVGLFELFEAQGLVDPTRALEDFKRHLTYLTNLLPASLDAWNSTNESNLYYNPSDTETDPNKRRRRILFGQILDEGVAQSGPLPGKLRIDDDRSLRRYDGFDAQSLAFHGGLISDPRSPGTFDAQMLGGAFNDAANYSGAVRFTFFPPYAIDLWYQSTQNFLFNGKLDLDPPFALNANDVSYSNSQSVATNVNGSAKFSAAAVAPGDATFKRSPRALLTGLSGASNNVPYVYWNRSRNEQVPPGSIMPNFDGPGSVPATRISPNTTDPANQALSDPEKGLLFRTFWQILCDDDNPTLPLLRANASLNCDLFNSSHLAGLKELNEQSMMLIRAGLSSVNLIDQRDFGEELLKNFGTESVTPLKVPLFQSGLDSAMVYGSERQPFITQLALIVEAGEDKLAVELYNPYDRDIKLDHWVLAIVTRNGGKLSVKRKVDLNGELIPAGKFLVVQSSAGFVVPSNTDWPGDGKPGDDECFVKMAAGINLVTSADLKPEPDSIVVLFRPQKTGVASSTANPLANMAPVDLVDLNGMFDITGASAPVPRYYARPTSIGAGNNIGVNGATPSVDWAWGLYGGYQHKNPDEGVNTLRFSNWSNVKTPQEWSIVFGAKQRHQVPDSRPRAPIVGVPGAQVANAQPYDDVTFLDYLYPANNLTPQKKRDLYPPFVGQFPRIGDLLQLPLVGSFVVKNDSGDYVGLMAMPLDRNMAYNPNEPMRQKARANIKIDIDNRCLTPGTFLPPSLSDPKKNDADHTFPVEQLLAAKLMERFNVRENDGNQNALDMGVVNINTAPVAVLEKLPLVVDGRASGNGEVTAFDRPSTAANLTLRKTIRAKAKAIHDAAKVRPFLSIADPRLVRILQSKPEDFFLNGWDTITDKDQYRLGDITPTKNDLAYTDANDPVYATEIEYDLYNLTRNGNLISTQSDTFTVHVIVQGWLHAGTDQARLVDEHRQTFIVDRSKVNGANATLSALGNPIRVQEPDDTP